MEAMRNSVNSYPDNSMMELFLEVGNKLGMLETFKKKDKNGEYVFYKGDYVIADLIAACSYLNKSENEEIKKDFLEKIGKEDPEKMLKQLGIYCLKYWESMSPSSSFVQARVNKQMGDIEGKSGLSLLELPIISVNIMPEWYHEMVKNRTLIHEKFELELRRRKEVSQKADKIQDESYNHPFERPVDTKKIDDLKAKL